MDDILKNKKALPSPPPPYIPPALLTTKEIKTEREKPNEDFIKPSIQINKDELDAAD